MVALIEYAFSWWTFIAVLVYFAFAVALYRRIRDSHAELHERFGGHRVWFSAPDQIRFFGYVWSFRYFEEHDSMLSILALLSQLTGIIALVLLFTRPLHFAWHS